MPPEMSAFNKQPSQKKKADIFGVTRNVGPQVQPSQKNADIFDGIRNVGPQQVQPSQKKMPTFWVPSEMSALNKPQVQKKKPTFSMPSDMSALQTKKKCRHFWCLLKCRPSTSNQVKKKPTFLVSPEMSALKSNQVKKNADIFDGIRNVGPQQVPTFLKAPKMSAFFFTWLDWWGPTFLMVPKMLALFFFDLVACWRPTFQKASKMSALKSRKETKSADIFGVTRNAGPQQVTTFSMPSEMSAPNKSQSPKDAHIFVAPKMSALNKSSSPNKNANINHSQRMSFDFMHHHIFQSVTALVTVNCHSTICISNPLRDYGCQVSCCSPVSDSSDS